MYGEPYQLQLHSQPGDRLSKERRNSLVAEFESDTELLRLIRYDVARERATQVADLWRELREIFRGSEAEFQALLRDNDFPLTLEEAEAYDRRTLERHGNSLLTVRLPRSQELASAVYHKLVEFCRRNALCLGRVDLSDPGTLPPDWNEFTASWTPPSLPGFFVAFGDGARSDHFAGGENRWNGAECPNCRKPLILHLTLCTEDERLGISGLGVRRLPLLFCKRCNLGYDDDFVYRVADDTTVEILRYAQGSDEPYRRDWYEHIGLDVLPQWSVSLLPISPRVQELLDVMNRCSPAPPDKMTDAETAELKSLLAQYDSPSIAKAASYAVNQVGGRPYVPQSLMFPNCPYCEKHFGRKNRMDVLANLTNDKHNGFVVSFDTVYITFFLCTDCRTVHVEEGCT